MSIERLEGIKNEISEVTEALKKLQQMQENDSRIKPPKETDADGANKEPGEGGTVDPVPPEPGTGGTVNPWLNRVRMIIEKSEQYLRN